jgi:hypothetical protein
LKEIPLEDDLDLNKLWVIVRYLTINGHSNEYRLYPRSAAGVCLKIGRVKFRVRDLQLSEDDNKTDFNSFAGAAAQAEDLVNSGEEEKVMIEELSRNHRSRGGLTSDDINNLIGTT